MLNLNRQILTSRWFRVAPPAMMLLFLITWLYLPRNGKLQVNNPYWWLDEATSSVEQIGDRDKRAVLSEMLLATTADVYGAMAVADAKVGNATASKEAFAKALDAARTISDPALRKRTYIGLACEHVRAGDLSGAKTAVLQIEPNSQVDGYLAIALTQVEIGDIAGAVEAAENPTIRGPIAHDAYVAIAIAQARSGDQGVAQEYLDRAIGAYIGDGWAALDAWSATKDRCVVADVQVQRGELDLALLTAARSEVSEIAFAKARACAAIASARAANGHVDDAKDLFNQAIESVSPYKPAAAEVAKLKDKISVLLDIAWAQRSAGDDRASDATLQLAMQVPSFVSDRSTRDRVFGEVVPDRINCGDLKGASACANSIESEQDRVAATSRVPTTSTSSSNSYLSALAPGGRVGVHYSAVFTAIASNDFELAQSHLDRIESDVAVMARAHVLCEAIRHLGVSRDSQRVQGWIDRASADVSRIESATRRHDAQVQLVAALAALGRFDQAIDFVAKIDDEAQQELALSEIAIAQAVVGRVDDAIATAGLVKNEDMPLARAWQAIATAQADAGLGVAARVSFTTAVKASQGAFDLETTREWLHGVIRTRIECGDFEGAIQDALPYSGGPRIAEYFKTIGCAAVQSGKAPQLLELIRLTDDPVLKAALQLGAAVGAAPANKAMVPSARP